MSEYLEFYCKHTGKYYKETIVGTDGRVYEKDYIEHLYKKSQYNNKEAFLSPIDFSIVSAGGIIFTQFNERLNKFYNEHPEYITLRYELKSDVMTKFDEHINIDISKYDDYIRKFDIENIFKFIDKYKEFKFNIENRDIYIKIINNEKGLKLVLNNVIYYNSKYINYWFIIEYSDICILAYDLIIKHYNYHDRYIVYSGIFNRYDLMVKLYEFDKKNYNNQYSLDNCYHNHNQIELFKSAIKSSNINILKFLHNINPDLYKQKTKLYNSRTDNITIISFILYVFRIKNMEVIKYFFSIDKNILNINYDDKSEIFNEIETYENENKIEILELIVGINN